MAGTHRSELEVMFRASLAVHRVVRDAATSPHRADIVAMGADGTPTEELEEGPESPDPEEVRGVDPGEPLEGSHEEP